MMILNSTGKRKRRKRKKEKKIIKHFIDLKAMIQKLCYISIPKRSFEKERGGPLLKIALVLLSETITLYTACQRTKKCRGGWFRVFCLDFFFFLLEVNISILWTVCMLCVWVLSYLLVSEIIRFESDLTILVEM